MVTLAVPRFNRVLRFRVSVSPLSLATSRLTIPSLAAISKLLPELRGKNVLTFQYDGGDKYLSVEGLY